MTFNAVYDDESAHLWSEVVTLTLADMILCDVSRVCRCKGQLREYGWVEHPQTVELARRATVLVAYRVHRATHPLPPTQRADFRPLPG